MNNQTVNDGKTLAIICYITLIGTIIAFVLNQNKQNPFASFHIRQSIGIGLLSFVVSFITRFTYFNWIDNLMWLGVFALWIIGLIGAAQGEEKKIPLLGNQFQEWFKNIG
jgi:uncharacterized membrane protein